MKAALDKNIRKLLSNKDFTKQLLKSIKDLNDNTSTEFKVKNKTYILKEVK